MNATHIPGNDTQWSPSPWSRGGHRDILSATGGQLAETFSWMGLAEADANERLIAAAPELYAALEELVSLTDRKHNAWDNARAALSKARRGEAQGGGIRMKLPKTILGWKRLFWIALRRCVQCHGPLCRHWPQYDDGTLWCLHCGGVPHPDGVLAALRWNQRACEKCDELTVETERGAA